jgi:hypothetical protein
VRYYGRMRDIEVAAHQLNAVTLDGLGEVSAPRVDTSWASVGDWADPGTAPPRRREPDQMRRLMRLRFVLPNVMFPHVLAVVLGAVLFVAAANDAWGLDALVP